MGSHEKEDRDATIKNKKIRRIVKMGIAFLGSFTISIVGGLILALWELRHHPTNSQLWMVPSGLILLVTPVMIWFSVFVSDIFNPSPTSNPMKAEEEEDHNDDGTSNRNLQAAAG